jgi:hypothetical protein
MSDKWVGERVGERVCSRLLPVATRSVRVCAFEVGGAARDALFVFLHVHVALLH